MIRILKEEEATRFAQAIVDTLRIIEQIRVRASRDLKREVSGDEIREELDEFMDTMRLVDDTGVIQRYVEKPSPN